MSKPTKSDKRPDSATVRVFPRTRRRIKIFAKRHDVTAARYLDDLVPGLSDHESVILKMAKASKGK